MTVPILAIRRVIHCYTLAAYTKHPTSTKMAQIFQTLNSGSQDHQMWISRLTSVKFSLYHDVPVSQARRQVCCLMCQT